MTIIVLEYDLETIGFVFAESRHYSGFTVLSLCQLSPAIQFHCNKVSDPH